MSTPFTPVASWDHAQDRARGNELVLAYSERRQALGQSAISLLTEGANAQDPTLWRAIQEWIDANYTSFVDHVSGPLTPAKDGLLFWTSATFPAAAGLHADGWRRATEWDGVNDPAWSYGTIQSGDIRGPWVFEDLQKAFSMLLCAEEIGFDWEHELRYADSGYVGTCEDALALALGGWTSSSWGYHEYYPIGAGYMFNNLFFSKHLIGHWRGRAKYHTHKWPDLSFTPDTDIYSRFVTPNVWGLTSHWSDFDAIGAADGLFHFVTTIPAGPGAVRYSPWFGDIASGPLQVVGASCPEATGNEYGWALGDQVAVARFNFTNA